MFDWITKPYIQWNVLDTILCYVEVGILLLILAVVIVEIQDLIEKRKNLKRRLNRYVKDKR